MFDGIGLPDAAHILPIFTFIANLQIATFQVDNPHMVNRIMQLDGVWGKTES